MPNSSFLLSFFELLLFYLSLTYYSLVAKESLWRNIKF